MSDRDDLRRTVDELEDLLRQSANLSDDLDDHRRRGIELRREIGQKVAAIGSLVEKAFDAASEQGSFRSEFSKMRSAMAYHQASWPIVSIKPDDAGYIASVAALREANRHFISWVRAALAAG